MSNASFILMPTASPAYWPGARLLAVLAFPPMSGKPQTWRDAEAMFGRNLMLHLMANDPDWGESEQRLVPRHALLGAGRSDKLSALVFGKLLNDRMGAAHVAWPLFQEADKLARNLPSHARRSTTIDREITRTVHQEHDRVDFLGKLGISVEPRFPADPNNFDARVLRASLPVLHIAMAAASLIDESQRTLQTAPQHEQDRFPIDAGGPQISYLHFLENPILVSRTVAYAEYLEGLLPYFTKLRISPQKVVRLRQS